MHTGGTARVRRPFHEENKWKHSQKNKHQQAKNVDISDHAGLTLYHAEECSARLPRSANWIATGPQEHFLQSEKCR